MARKNGGWEKETRAEEERALISEGAGGRPPVTASPAFSSSAPILTLDTTKAGMGSVRKEDAERIINSISAGSPFYANEERKRRQRDVRAAEILKKIEPLREALTARGSSDGVREISNNSNNGCEGGIMPLTRTADRRENNSVDQRSGVSSVFRVKKEEGQIHVHVPPVKIENEDHDNGRGERGGTRKGEKGGNESVARCWDRNHCAAGNRQQRLRLHTCGAGQKGRREVDSSTASRRRVACEACIEDIVSSCDAAEEELIQKIAGFTVTTLAGGWKKLRDVRATLCAHKNKKTEGGDHQRRDPLLLFEARSTMGSDEDDEAEVFLPTLNVKVPHFFGVYAHLDMDAFFAAVEEKYDPRLREIPFAVGGMSMLSTSNYKARQYGVRAAMPGYIAKRLCPDLTIVKCNFERYVAESAVVKEIVSEYDPQFSSGGLDEMGMNLLPCLLRRRQALLGLNGYLSSHKRREESKRKGDSTLKVNLLSEKEIHISNKGGQEEEEEHGDSHHPASIVEVDVLRELPSLIEEASAVVEEIRQGIFESTALTASAGIAATRTIAKMMSNRNKPNGQYAEGFRASNNDKPFSSCMQQTSDGTNKMIILPNSVSRGEGNCAIISTGFSLPPEGLSLAGLSMYRRHVGWLSGKGLLHSPNNDLPNSEEGTEEEEAQLRSSDPSVCKVKLNCSAFEEEISGGHSRLQEVSGESHSARALALVAHMATNIIGPLRPREVPFIGKATEELLTALGVATCFDLYRLRYVLRHALTPKTFDHMLSVAFGAMGHSSSSTADSSEETAGPSTLGEKRSRGDEHRQNERNIDRYHDMNCHDVEFARTGGDTEIKEMEENTMGVEERELYFNPFGKHKRREELTRKSLSIDRTFSQCANPSEFLDVALRITNIVANRMLKEKLTYKHVTLKLKGRDFVVKQYSKALSSYVVRAKGERAERPAKKHRQEACPMALPTPCAEAAPPRASRSLSKTRGDNKNAVCAQTEDEAEEDAFGGTEDGCSSSSSYSSLDGEDTSDADADAELCDKGEVVSHELCGIRRTLWTVVSQLLGPHLASYDSYRLMGVRCGTLALEENAVPLNNGSKFAGQHTMKRSSVAGCAPIRATAAVHNPSSVSPAVQSNVVGTGGNEGSGNVLAMMRRFATQNVKQRSASIATNGSKPHHPLRENSFARQRSECITNGSDKPAMGAHVKPERDQPKLKVTTRVCTRSERTLQQRQQANACIVETLSSDLDTADEGVVECEHADVKGDIGPPYPSQKSELLRRDETRRANPNTNNNKNNNNKRDLPLPSELIDLVDDD